MTAPAFPAEATLHHIYELASTLATAHQQFDELARARPLAPEEEVMVHMWTDMLVRIRSGVNELATRYRAHEIREAHTDFTQVMVVEGGSPHA